LPISPEAPPRWFQFVRRAIVSAYVAIALGSLAAGFLLMAVSAVVYRDFSDYQLYGNPWEPSSFPWYIIWNIRLLSITGAMAAGGFAFVVLFQGAAFLLPARLGPVYVRQILAALIALAIEFAALAWFMRWFG